MLLCLLVLFAALGVTYVLMASQYRKSTIGPPRAEQYAPDYRNQLDEAAMQVFRGTNNPLSVLSIHSLLEDMYGNDAVASTSTSFTTASTTTPPPFGSSAPATTISSATISLSSANTNPAPAPPPSAKQLQLIDLTLTLSGTTTPAPLPWPLSFNSAASSAKNSAANLATGSTNGFTSPYKGITDATYGFAPSGFFNGCVLTFTSGPAAGQSTRIVGYDNGIKTAASGGATNSTGTVTLRVMDFPGSSAMVNAPVATTNAWNFLINGRPFNGVGFGFNFATNLVDAIDPSSNLFALLPNPAFFFNGSTSAPATAYNVAGGIGGADEDYDAADWNNLLLGLPLDPRDVTGTLPTTATPSPTPINFPPYPSLHRPELVAYWMNSGRLAGGGSNWSLLLEQIQSLPAGSLQLQAATLTAHQIMLRPQGYAGPQITVDHPNFTGSNSNTNTNYAYPSTAAVGFDPVNGPWDVDNDGDGVADSIWVDLGSPVQTAADGTTYKPLYAIRVLDMDGRLNVNAHGNSGQTETAFANATPVTADFPGSSGTLTTLTPSTAAVGHHGPHQSHARARLRLWHRRDQSAAAL